MSLRVRGGGNIHFASSASILVKTHFKIAYTDEKCEPHPNHVDTVEDSLTIIRQLNHKCMCEMICRMCCEGRRERKEKKDGILQVYRYRWR